MQETPYVETEALLLALEDARIDSSVFEVDNYLREHFTIGKLRRLEDATDLLSARARAIRHEKLK